jgi:alpha-maltose-1-phosphate synthase
VRIAILTNEYPPNVYGGAGVHVEYLTRELAKLDGGKNPVKVFCFGDQKSDNPPLSVTGVQPSFKLPADDQRHQLFLDTMLRDIMMAGLAGGVDVVHCHTWYSHFAGLLVKQLQKVPLVLTTHSLEPHRPWKAEQLGTAYNATSWIEKTAYENADGVVAVSESMKKDVHEIYKVPLKKIRVIHNGIDAAEFKPAKDAGVLDKYKIDRNIPYVLFVGRVTRQKGIIHLVNAVRHLKPGLQVVLCAGSPDTKEIGAEMEQKVAKARGETKNNIIWIREMVSKEDLIPLYSQASLFVCPSVYEPFGIINLEAMACEVPVVASKVGGIPEVVIPGETGLLVPFKAKSRKEAEPADAEIFSRDLAAAVNSLMDSPARLKKYGLAARRRVIENFDWKIIAARTLDFYKELL